MVQFFGDLAQWWKVHHLSSIADAWDARRTEMHDMVERQSMLFIDRHPNLWGIVVAGTETTLLDFTTTIGASFVDVLRVGQGIKKHSLRGVAEDGLRVLSVVPFGTLARFANTARGVSMLKVARLVTDPFKEFGICTTVAATQALRMVNVRHAVLVDDLLRVAGIDLTVAPGVLAENVGGRFIKDLVPALKSFGAKVTRINPVKTIAEIEAALRGMGKTRGVMMFSAEWRMFDKATRTMKPAAHTMLAFIDEAGVFRIANRTGHVVEDLKQLSPLMPSIGKAVPAASSMAFVENAAVVRLAELERWAARGIVNALAIEVRSVPLLTRDPSHAATVH